MCTRTVSTLARALEASGIATVSLLANRSAAERVGPPRGLFCDFPLGRPLGKPLDPAFQRSVLETAFGLLPRRDGPVIEDFGLKIEDAVEEPVACPIPPRLDPSEPAAVAEARALRAAFDRGGARSGGTQLGCVVDADGVPDAIHAFVEVVDGAGWQDVEYVGGNPTTLLMDLRAYYEQAALGLTDSVPAARSTETWYYQKTAMGLLARRYLERVKDADPPFPGTFYIVPASQTEDKLF